jgi:hypothetical protein
LFADRRVQNTVGRFRKITGDQKRKTEKRKGQKYEIFKPGVGFT